MTFGRVQLAELTSYSKKCQQCKNPLLLSKQNGQFTWKRQNLITLKIHVLLNVERKTWRRFFRIGTYRVLAWCCQLIFSSINCRMTCTKTKLCSLKKAKMGEQQWKNAQESLLSLEKKNVASVDSIVRYAMLIPYNTAGSVSY